MKVNEVLREAMQAMVLPFDNEDMRQAYREGRFPRADKVKDLDKRYRWDLFYRSGMGMLFDDRSINGDHIYTALKRVVPSLSEGK